MTSYESEKDLGKEGEHRNKAFWEIQEEEAWPVYPFEAFLKCSFPVQCLPLLDLDDSVSADSDFAEFGDLDPGPYPHLLLPFCLLFFSGYIKFELQRAGR